MSAVMTIELATLQMWGRHGWHEEEAKTGNQFEVAITASFPTDAMITTLDETVSYISIYEIAKEVMEEREQLLETVAIKMAEKLKEAYPQLTHLRISIKKLAAPIAGFNGTVGITYEHQY